MLYPKNVPNIERVLRIVGGAIMVVLAVFGGSLFGEAAPLISAVLLLSAAVMVVTGFVGWCPACAMVGRKLKS